VGLLDTPQEGTAVLRYPGLFLLLALVAGAFGFGGVGGDAAEFLKTLFFVLVALAVLGCVLNRTRDTPGPIDEESDLTVPYFPPGHGASRPQRSKRSSKRK
jgi:uncharacterized membrane protein YtjA (UPF0391 family)